MIVQAKTIKLLLYDGTLQGVICIEDSNWNSGELYSAPKESISKLMETDACKKYGVYLLLSSDKVYVGQASNLAERIHQHINGKDWWERVVILTTKDDSLTRSGIDYLENSLINKALTLKKLDCDNRKKGNSPKVDKFDKEILNQYIAEAMFLMELIGISVFSEVKSSKQKVRRESHPLLIQTVGSSPKLEIGKRAKKEAINYILENGISLEKSISYAVRQEKRITCWVNPKVELLQKEWNLILNNTKDNELIILHIPANSLHLQDKKHHGLKVRSDKPELIDMNISVDTLVDTVSHIDLSTYCINRLYY